ncbi:MAG: glucose-1-phosphate cytidylyltransferase [Armatimonadota bacterium]
MKAVILAGGYGTRLSEETALRPKPMVEIGGRPMLWHIMNVYAAHGIEEFVVAAGYKAEVIKQYFLNFYAINNDVTIDLTRGETKIHDGKQPRWRVHVCDTGLNTQTGGRIRRLRDWLQEDELFLLTYGDCLADLDIRALLDFHRSHGKLATLTAVLPPARFGRLSFEGDRITTFMEKPVHGEGWINGGYFVLHRSVIDYIDGDDTIWERDPLERLVRDGELMGYQHRGFWSPMDTLREKNSLEEIWASGRAPWKCWK